MPAARRSISHKFCSQSLTCARFGDVVGGCDRGCLAPSRTPSWKKRAHSLDCQRHPPPSPSSHVCLSRNTLSSVPLATTSATGTQSLQRRPCLPHQIRRAPAWDDRGRETRLQEPFSPPGVHLHTPARGRRPRPTLPGGGGSAPSTRTAPATYTSTPSRMKSQATSSLACTFLPPAAPFIQCPPPPFRLISS